MDKGSTANDQYETTDASGWPNRSVVSPTGEGFSIMSQGWYCPRCHKINSPELMQCYCNPDGLPYVTHVGAAPMNINVKGAGASLKIDGMLRNHPWNEMVFKDDEER